MKICIIGNSKNYKTSVTNYLWSGALWYYPPTIGYQIIPYANHVIYDVSSSCSDKCSPPYHLMDIFILFLDSKINIKGKTSEEWYKLIKKHNRSARVVATLSPTSLTECVELVKEIKILLG